MSLKKVIACIKRNKKFLITTHTNLEGDALGSELAFYMLLKKLRKQAIIVNEDDLPYGYEFLPGIANIKKFKPNLKNIEFDCFAILDCSDLSRCAEVHRLNSGKKPVLNIDHHISNENFGDINWVEPEASSCAQMVYQLYKELGVPLNKEIAMFLYVGILADTGSFRYSNTTAFTHRIASELLRYPLDIWQIYKRIYENIPFADMQLLTQILPTIRCCSKGMVAWCQIERSMLKDKKIVIDLSENILSFCRAIKDAEVAVLFKENLGKKLEVRVNLRSQGKIDVNKIAAFFGGGGHKTASGCTTQGRLDDVRRKVLRKIEEALNQ